MPPGSSSADMRLARPVGVRTAQRDASEWRCEVDDCADVDACRRQLDVDRLLRACGLSVLTRVVLTPLLVQALRAVASISPRSARTPMTVRDGIDPRFLGGGTSSSGRSRSPPLGGHGSEERARSMGRTGDRVVQGVSVMRKLLSTAVAAVAVVAGASVAPPAPAVGTGAPVVVSPANGTEVPSGFDGPVTVDFTAAAAGTYRILVGAEEGGLGDVELASVEVDDTTTTVQRALPEPLDKGGVYRVLVRTGDPSNPVDVQSRFTVLGGEDPVILSPGRSVPLGYAGPLLVDFTTAPVGYYDLTLRRSCRRCQPVVGGDAEQPRGPHAGTGNDRPDHGTGQVRLHGDGHVEQPRVRRETDLHGTPPLIRVRQTTSAATAWTVGPRPCGRVYGNASGSLTIGAWVRGAPEKTPQGDSGERSSRERCQ